MTDWGHPRGWTETSLGDVVSVVRRREDPKTYPAMPFIGMEHVEPHTMRIIATVPACNMKSAATHFVPGDVLYGRLRPYLNKVVSPRFEGLASAEFIPLTPASGIATDFIRFLLNSADFVEFASNLDEGDRPRADWEGISEFRFLLPPSSEQLRILDALESYLTRLDAAVANLERAQTKLEAYRASVLKAAVEGRLVPTEADLARAEHRDYEPADVLLKRVVAQRRCSEDAEFAKNPRRIGARKGRHQEPTVFDTGILAELPDGWCWTTVGQLAEVSGGLTKNSDRERYSNKIPYLRVANVYANSLALDEIKEIGVSGAELQRVLLEAGDLLIVEGNGSVGQIGRVAIWDGSIAPMVHQNHLIKARFLIAPTHRWTLTWLLSPGGRRMIEQAASSTSGLHTLSISKVGSLAVPLPPANEQERILERLDSAMSLVDANESTVEKTRKCSRRLQQGILKWAFEGRLVDQDPSDVSAEKLLASFRAERAVMTSARNFRRHGRVATR